MIRTSIVLRNYHYVSLSIPLHLFLPKHSEPFLYQENPNKLWIHPVNTFTKLLQLLV